MLMTNNLGKLSCNKINHLAQFVMRNTDHANEQQIAMVWVRRRENSIETKQVTFGTQISIESTDRYVTWWNICTSWERELSIQCNGSIDFWIKVLHGNKCPILYIIDYEQWNPVPILIKGYTTSDS